MTFWYSPRAKIQTRCGPQTLDGLDLVKLDFVAAIANRRLPDLRRLREAMTELVRSFQPDILHLNDVLIGSFFFRRGRRHREICRASWCFTRTSDRRAGTTFRRASPTMPIGSL